MQDKQLSARWQCEGLQLGEGEKTVVSDLGCSLDFQRDAVVEGSLGLRHESQEWPRLVSRCCLWVVIVLKELLPDR